MYRMTKPLIVAVAVLLLVAPFSYAGGSSDKNPAQPQTPSASPGQTAAPQAQAAPPPAPSKSITILPPRGVGLAKDQAYLPDFVANELVSNFNSFSGMTLFDRVNNQKQYDELLSGYYADDDKAGLDLGHLASTDYMLLGDITKTSTGYALQLTVNSNSDKTTAAAYSAAVAIAELDNLIGIRKASLDLLEKMGVQITAQARTELTSAAASSRVNAQTAMAQGMVAQRGGTVVEALSSFIQASNYDSTVAEAASRLNILSANVTSGNIGENVRNDLQWRDQWVARLQECETFYANYLREAPPYYLVYSPNIKQGEVDYQKRTVSLTVESLASYPEVAWFSTVNQVVKTVKQGLTATKRAEVWGLDNWPAKSITTLNPFVNRFNCFMVEMEILNSDGKSVAAKQTVRLLSGWEALVTEDRVRITRGYSDSWITREVNYAKPIGGIQEIIFPAADPNAITDNLSIRITTIDGIPAATASAQKRINILTAAQYTALPNARAANQSNGNNNSAWSFFRIDTDRRREYVEMWKLDHQLTRRIAYIRDGVMYISGFSGSDLVHVNIPNSVTIIDRNAFEDNRLTSITIPNSVTRIESSAFAGNRLTSITIPNSVTEIDYEAFDGNPLTSITIGANKRVYEYSFGSALWLRYFNSRYNDNGKKAGTYTYDSVSKEWSYMAR